VRGRQRAEGTVSSSVPAEYRLPATRRLQRAAVTVKRSVRDDDRLPAASAAVVIAR
jgi:hypothetical protein